MKWICIPAILIFSTCAFPNPLAQLQRRPDGIWLVYSNTPNRWSLQKSTNLLDWHPMLEGKTNVASVEVQLESNMEMIYYRLEALPE